MKESGCKATYPLSSSTTCTDLKSWKKQRITPGAGIVFWRQRSGLVLKLQPCASDQARGAFPEILAEAIMEASLHCQEK